MFDLLETCIIALRGYKKPSTTLSRIETLDMDSRFEGNVYIPGKKRGLML